MNKYLNDTGRPKEDSLCLFGSKDDLDNKKDDIFLSYENNIRGYLTAINNLLEPLKDRKLNPLDDLIAMPLLFLSCHTLELCFKMLIYAFHEHNRQSGTSLPLKQELREKIEKILVGTHDLSKLLDVIQEVILIKQYKESFKMPESIEKMISEFKYYKISSIESRYIFNKKNNRFELHTFPRLNIQIFDIRNEIDVLFYKVLKYWDKI